MIGDRLQVGDNRFDYVIGLLIDGGLVPDVDFMPTGGNEVLIAQGAWPRLDADTQHEITRFVPGIKIVPEPPGGGDDPEALTEHGGSSPSGRGDTGDVPVAPPRSGAGSGRDAWASYARELGLEVTPDLNRDDIIALVEESP
jgi:hypothetical protein